MTDKTELLTVIRDVNSPPNGWRYTPPQTGVTLTARFWGELRGKVHRHLAANSVEITDELLEVIEDGACRESSVGMPAGWCAKRAPKPVEGTLPYLTLAHLDRFLKSILPTLIKRDFVSREEAERRAEICRTCPLVTGGISGCSGCFTLLSKVQSLIQKSPIQMEDEKNTCGACGCYVPALIWCKNSTLDKAAGDKMPKYAEGHCWRLGK